ncbi:tRNA lysidine(34) synthetase TilS [Lacihabitans sp. LS3-19]|uniref:tRNA lysidine(34) synthetase TilS n=1 Tax=Lacihabitans sp. LS3-19 TaxID=2487335 RepID=UPI0020CD8233|nr:tRNA lysidine(34) synthetase TilS [Lacihabitans sp. LS3-19]MCP9766830.1 tRNA lysidine(34) synthetase TilS [Lacihabitans sp. LS3-19]
MLEDFLKFINNHQLCKATDKVLVAVSGGKDSMALLHLFIEAKFNISVAHFNFGLRGAASDGDEEFVRDFCATLKVPFFSTKTDTKKKTKELGVSTQMAARELRYTWFRELIDRENFNYLATAHNLNDKIETLLLNIAKGTGPKGLKSIPLKNDQIIRPLMFANVSQIFEYIETKQIKWREDSSNQTVDYQRNKIRHQVIPVLSEINPGLSETAKVNFRRFDALNEIFEEKLEAFKAEIEFGEIIKIYPANWKGTAGFSLILEEFLKPYGFNFQDVNDFLKIEDIGKKVISASHTLSFGRNEWFLEKTNFSKNEILTFDKPGNYEIGDKLIKIEETKDFPNIMEIRNSEHAFLDFDKIRWPLSFRNWEQGDRFQPYGMKGKKLVSDFLIDIKMDAPLKKTQKVLSDKEGVLWLVGLRIDDRVKLQSDTKNILKVSFCDI